MSGLCKRFAALALAACVVAPLGARASDDDEAAMIRAALGAAPQQGFPAGEFNTGPGAGTEALERAAIRYAEAQHGLRLRADRLPHEWALRPAPYDAKAEFDKAKADGRLQGWLDALPPDDPAYRALIGAYARYQALARQGGWPRVTLTAKPGDQGPAVDALRARLAAEGDSVAAAGAYDDALKADLAEWQERHGLANDGVAGRTTLAALNVSAEERVRQIEANLERRRWLPRSPPVRRVELNIADASLSLIEPGRPPLTMRAVVGQPKKRTPMFADQIKAVVLNPPWVVPNDIAAKEIWPKIRKNPGYAAREGFVVRNGGQLVQLPGPKCALGAIKFDLSNPFGVYLHDTPAKSLFAKPVRALSHGCMRLESPNELAKRILAEDPKWSGPALDLALLDSATVRIPLKTPVALYVGYFTAFVDPDGTVEFRPDLYGWDRDLLELLADPGARR